MLQLLALCALLLPGTLQAAEFRPANHLNILSAAEIDYPPFSQIDEQGQASGFSVELLRESLDAMGYGVSFTTGSWPEIKQALTEDRIEVLPLVGRTPEREQVFDFTFPYLYMHGTIVVREDEQQIQGPKDLVGKQVAVLRGDNAEEFLQRQEIGARINLRDSFETALIELSRGEHDAVVIQKLLASELIQKNHLRNLRMVGPPLRGFVQEFCFAVHKGQSHLLSVLNEGLSIVIADGRFQHLRAKWFGSLYAPLKSRLIVGGDRDYPPYEYLDENGKPAGFNVDLTRAIAGQLGVEVDIQLDSWNRVRDGLDDGRIDLIQGMFYSAKRDESIDFSPAHSIVGHSIVTRKGDPAYQNLEQLAGKSILVRNGDIMHDLAIRQGYGDQLILVNTQEEALNRLATGQGDCVLVARIPALYWIDKHSWNNLVVGPNPVLAREFCYAVLHGNEALLANISDALASLKQSGAYRQIYSKWFNVYETSGPAPGQILRYSLIGLLPILLLVAAVVFWNKSLKRQVRARTAELREEISERQRAEAVLQAQENKFRTLFEHISDYVLILKPEGNDLIITDLSTSACSHHGYQREELLGQSINLLDADGVDIENHEGISALAKGEVLHLEVNHRHKDGHVFPVETLVKLIEIDGEPLLVSIERDMTQRKKAEQEKADLEQQLRQKYKMEAVGIMAGGMAHNFNNNLAIILGNIEMARLNMDQNSREAQCLDHALTAAQRAGELIRQIMTYSRDGSHEKLSIKLAPVIDETLKLLRSTIPSTVKLQVDVPQEDLHLTVHADAARIQEALLNLCNNAVQAMEEKGTLTISLTNTRIEPEEIPAHFACSPGNYALLKVSDSGCGMSEEILPKIFDPFFTTKGVGDGTGIGLSSVQGIVKQHGGLIKVTSQPARGSTFELYFPLVEESVSEPLTVDEDLPGGSERILIVDDEEMLSETVATILMAMGYQVTTEVDSLQALAKIKESPEAFDLVISDQTMPNLTGKELAMKVQSQAPALPFILYSGYSSGLSQNEAEVLGISGFFMKPLEMPKLLHEVRRVLDENCRYPSIRTSVPA